MCGEAGASAAEYKKKVAYTMAAHMLVMEGIHSTMLNLYMLMMMSLMMGHNIMLHFEWVDMMPLTFIL